MPNANTPLIAGQLIELGAAFRDRNGNLGDPTTVAFAYTVNGAEYGPFVYGAAGSNVVRDNIGIFRLDIDSTGLSGNWVAQVAGTGNIQALDVAAFKVLAPPVNPPT